MPKRARLAGLYRIVEMEQWDEDFLDLVTQAYIKIGADGSSTTCRRAGLEVRE